PGRSGEGLAFVTEGASPSNPVVQEDGLLGIRRNDPMMAVNSDDAGGPPTLPSRTGEATKGSEEITDRFEPTPQKLILLPKQIRRELLKQVKDEFNEESLGTILAVALQKQMKRLRDHSTYAAHDLDRYYGYCPARARIDRAIHSAAELVEIVKY